MKNLNINKVKLTNLSSNTLIIKSVNGLKWEKASLHRVVIQKCLLLVIGVNKQPSIMPTMNIWFFLLHIDELMNRFHWGGRNTVCYWLECDRDEIVLLFPLKGKGHRVPEINSFFFPVGSLINQSERRKDRRPFLVGELNLRSPGAVEGKVIESNRINKWLPVESLNAASVSTADGEKRSSTSVLLQTHENV